MSKDDLKEFNDAFDKFIKQVKIALLSPIAVKAIVIFFLVALGYLLSFTIYTATYEREINNRIRGLEISRDSLQVKVTNLEREIKETSLIFTKRDAQIIRVIESIVKKQGGVK
jgi:hypothetical protein